MYTKKRKNLQEGLRSSMKSKNILIVAAHPDDEILGCGGTVKKFVGMGYQAYTLILGEGITSRYEVRDRKKREKELELLKMQTHIANRFIGVEEVFLYDFPDNRFDTVPLLDIIKIIEKVKSEIKPEIIFTHHEKDLNIDHQITCRAVMTATRPTKGECVQEIYAFEIPSSTEWSFPLCYSPNIFVDIGETLEAKISAMKAYQSELKEYPHPRSLEGIELIARLWGMKVGLSSVEAFLAVRVLK
jgi:LmbE family N-acetylglucosaminyl deacetylase